MFANNSTCATNVALPGLNAKSLPANFVRRLQEDVLAGGGINRLPDFKSIATMPPNSSWCGVMCKTCPCCCCVGTLVQDGTLGVMREDAEFRFLAPGWHAYPSCGREMGEPVSLSSFNKSSTFGTVGMLNVSEGMVGVLIVNSTYRLMPPGIYQWDSPAVAVEKVARISDTDVLLGPYRLITVPEGMVAVTFHNGSLRIFGDGNDQQRTYFLDDVMWTFKCFLPTVMQTDRLEGNDLLSKDNVEILMVAMSQWRIVDPLSAVTHCAPSMEEIRTKVNHLVRATIARIVAGTNIGSGPVSGSVAHPVVSAVALGEPAKNAPNASPLANGSSTDVDLAHMMQSDLASKHMAHLASQMSLMGIEVLGVYVPEKRIKNDDIRSQIAKQAVIGIRAEAERAAADATAYATVKAARAQAEAVGLLAAAHAEGGQRLGHPDSTAARLALSEHLSKVLQDANVTIFSGAPGALPFMFGTEPRPNGGTRRKNLNAAAAEDNSLFVEDS